LLLPISWSDVASDAAILLAAKYHFEIGALRPKRKAWRSIHHSWLANRNHFFVLLNLWR
jgi:hypothetical protein